MNDLTINVSVKKIKGIGFFKRVWRKWMWRKVEIDRNPEMICISCISEEELTKMICDELMLP